MQIVVKRIFSIAVQYDVLRNLFVIEHVLRITNFFSCIYVFGCSCNVQVYKCFVT